MKTLALALPLAVFGLSACTTFHCDRRQMTEWNLGMLREPRDPCGTMPPDSSPDEARCGTKADSTARKVVDYGLVKPVAVAMLPISWLTDTLLLNPINGYRKAELENHERRFCHTGAEEGWTDAHAAHHAYGVVPVATPWVVSEALAAPEFAARWVWNSVYPTDPVNDDHYAQYWREHNESTGGTR